MREYIWRLKLQLQIDQMTTMAPFIICDRIVNTIKHSNLHFLLSENAFSAKITIRKKFIDENRSQTYGTLAESETVNLKTELERDQIV